MAENISVSKISNYVGQEVTIKGWVYNRTHKGKLVFLLVRDGSGFIQCVAADSLGALFEDAILHHHLVILF